MTHGPDFDVLISGSHIAVRFEALYYAGGKMHRATSLLSVFADLISVFGFAVTLLPILPNAGNMVLAYLDSLPFTLRVIVTIVIEVALAYTLSTLAMRLIGHDSRPLQASPGKFALFVVLSLAFAFVSISNVMRLIFQDDMRSIWAYVALFIIGFAVLLLCRWMIKAKLVPLRRGLSELRYAQRIMAGSLLVVIMAEALQAAGLRY